MRFIPILAAALAVATVHPAAAQRGCRIPAGQFFSLGTEPLEMTPGQAQQLSAGISPGPGILLALPRGCAVRWSLVGPAPARIDARGRLAIGPGAPIGAEFRVRAVMGRDTAVREVHVVDPRLVPVVGTWQQAQAAECASGRLLRLERVRELVFRRDGRFTVTFTPFETYNDYWGRYTWDAATRALSMWFEGGNRVPEGLDLNGTAHVANGGLELKDMWLGQPNSTTPEVCTYVFAH
jgi:hypothetical protein